MEVILISILKNNYYWEVIGFRSLDQIKIVIVEDEKISNDELKYMLILMFQEKME